MFEIDDLELDIDDDSEGPFGANTSLPFNANNQNGKESTNSGNQFSKTENEVAFIETNNVDNIKRTLEVKNDIICSRLDENIKSSVVKDSNNEQAAVSQTKGSITINSGTFVKPSILKESIQNNIRKNEGVPKKVTIKEPNAFKSKHVTQRKFPGPAGLLPDLPPNKDFNDSVIVDCNAEELEKEKQEEPASLCSQSSISIFSEPPYRKLLSDFGVNEPNSPLREYTIDWVKKKALNKTLYERRIPFLAVVLHNLDHSNPDPVVILKDPSGEIYGTLHREVWNDVGGKFHPGAAIALKQVRVSTTGASRRQAHLNISKNTIITIYSSSEVSEAVEEKKVNEVSSVDLLKSVDEWHAQDRSFASPLEPEKNSSSSLFSTVNDFEALMNSNKKTDAASKNQLLQRERLFNRETRSLSQQSASVRNLQPPVKRKSNEDVRENWNNVKILKDGDSASPCSFDLGDIDFDDEMDISDVDENKSKSPEESVKSIKFQPKFQVQLCNKRPVFVELEGEKKSKESEIRPQVLTQAESQIFQEVVDGIDLDEFDL